MNKSIICFLIVSMLLVPFCGISSAETKEWEKEVIIKKETVIDKGDLVKVKPGTKIMFAKGKSRLNILGELSVCGSEQSPVTIIIPNLMTKATPVLLQDHTILKINQGINELEIHPYRVETKEIVNELRAFRYQYAFVWTVLMGICFYLVLNRTTYW